MATHKNEHRDAYIAAIIGGVVLILILLWIYATPDAVQKAAQQTDEAPAPAGDTFYPPGVAGYTYNIPPYNPGGTNIGGSTFNSGLPGNDNGGCCDTCGPNGGTYISVNDFLQAVSP